MPRTLTKVEDRTNVRLPTPMIIFVDKTVEAHPELFNNRQQYIENAIRERLEKDNDQVVPQTEDTA